MDIFQVSGLLLCISVVVFRKKIRNANIRVLGLFLTILLLTGVFTYAYTCRNFKGEADLEAAILIGALYLFTTALVIILLWAPETDQRSQNVKVMPRERRGNLYIVK